MIVHELTFPDTDSLKYAQARYHYLLQVVFGETIAIDYCRTMATFAPNEESRNFLLQQQKDEDLHLEMLTEYVSTHLRTGAPVSPYLKKLDQIMSDAIQAKDYVSCVFIQNFIIEGLNISLLKEIEHHTDGVLSEMCTIILRDEVGHARFGVNELSRIIKEDTKGVVAKRLVKLQRQVLFYSIRLSMSLEQGSKSLGIPVREFTRRTVEEHRSRILSTGLPFSSMDRAFFATVIFIFSL